MILMRKLRLCFLLALAVFASMGILVTQAEALSFFSVKSGDWNDPTVWNQGVVPDPDTWVSNVIIQNTHTVTLTADAACDDLTINSGGTLTADTYTLTVSGNWDSSAGTFTEGTSTVVMTGTTKTLNNDDGFENLTINAGASVTVETSNVTITGDLAINGILAISDGITVTTLSAAGDDMSIGAAGQLTDANNAGTFVRLLVGSTPPITNNNSATGISVNTFRYSLWWLFGTPDTITSTKYGGDLYIQNGPSDGGEIVQLSAGTLSVTGDLYVQQTNWLVNANSYVTLDNTANNADIAVTGNLIIGTTEGGYTTFNTGSGTVTITGNVTINNCPSAYNNTLDASANPTINVGGDWINSDTFTAGTSTVTFNGTGTQSITSGSSPFNTIEITNSSADVTFLDNLTATNFTSNTGSVDMKFNAGSTYTITNLTLNGSPGNFITLGSTSPGTQWNLNVSGTQSLSYVDVADSNASGGDTIICAIGCVDIRANNDNWTGLVVSIPTMNEWGMIIFIVLAGIGSIYYLRRKRAVH